MLCRLCVNDSDNYLNIFDKNGKQLHIAEILGRHFWFKPHPDDHSSTVICGTCWLKVNDFHQFYLTIEYAHYKLSNHDVKEETFSDLTSNEFVSIKEESTEKACVSTDDSDSEIQNPLCEIECDSNKGAEVGEKEEQTNYCVRNKEDHIIEGGGESNDDYNSYKEDRNADKKDQSNDGVKEEATNIKKSLSKNLIRRKRKCVSEKPPSKKPKRVKQKELDEDIKKEKKLSDKPKERLGIKTKQEDDDMVKKYIQMNCDLCSYVSEDYPSLRKHFRLQHPQTKSFVRCCNKKLFHRLEIIHHAYKHDNPEFFKCKVCQKSFSEQSTLSRHMVAIHAPEEDLNFHCDQCPKRFARQKQLEFHRNSHVPMAERTFICDQCPNSRFASNDLLKIHICMRHRRAVNVCHVCAKEIRDKASFERHVSAHFEEMGPKVKCPFDECDHWLKDERNLRRHVRRVHTTERKTATCDECGRECKDKNALNRHKLRVHSNIVFTCEQCNKTFKRAIYLREHMAQHTGEILYQCPFCTRTFNSNANMHAHKKKIHPVEWDNWRKTNNGSLLQYSRQLDKVKISSISLNQ